MFLGDKEDEWRFLLMTLDELAELTNELISERRQYGEREETAAKIGQVIMWTNGSASWFVYHSAKRGQVLKLDANVVFVPGATKKDLERLIEMGMLLDLPLYGGSTERRMAGTPDYTGVELPPMIRLMKELGARGEEEVEDALLRKLKES